MKKFLYLIFGLGLVAPVALLAMQEEKKEMFECSICLEGADKGKVVSTTCNHKFHKKCINKWLDEKKSCPMCRKKQNPIELGFFDKIKSTIIKNKIKTVIVGLNILSAISLAYNHKEIVDPLEQFAPRSIL